MTNVNTAIVVELDKPPDASLALSLAEEAPFWFDDGAVATVVLHVDESSPAFGLLLQGDVILSVNGTEVTDARQAAELIHKASYLRLSVQRVPPWVPSNLGPGYSSLWLAANAPPSKVFLACACLAVVPLLLMVVSCRGELTRTMIVLHEAERRGATYKAMFVRSSNMSRTLVQMRASEKQESAQLHAELSAKSYALNGKLVQLDEMEHSWRHFNETTGAERASLLHDLGQTRAQLEAEKAGMDAERARLAEIERREHQSDAHLRGDVARRNHTMAKHLSTDAQVRARLEGIEATFQQALRGAIEQLDEAGHATDEASVPFPPPSSESTKRKGVRAPPPPPPRERFKGAEGLKASQVLKSAAPPPPSLRGALNQETVAARMRTAKIQHDLAKLRHDQAVAAGAAGPSHALPKGRKRRARF